MIQALVERRGARPQSLSVMVLKVLIMGYRVMSGIFCPVPQTVWEVLSHCEGMWGDDFAVVFVGQVMVYEN